MPPASGMLLATAGPPAGSMLLLLNVCYGPGGSIIVLGITAERIKKGPKCTSESLAPET